jgi:hypothetical protein
MRTEVKDVLTRGADNPSYRKEPPVGASFLKSCVEILLVNMSENKVV